MSVSIIGKRYARALLQLAGDAGAIERIGRDLRDFASSWTASRELRTVFENPSIPQASRAAILKELAQSAGMHEHTRNVLLVLSDRQRLSHVVEVSDAFDAMAEALSGKVRAEVTSASALPAAYYAELEGVLQAATGKDVVLVHNVDPSLVGGVVTKVGDRVFDGSIKSRLSELRDELLK
jgi:F-type H+-transporting ATPase subunit delta